jgi:prolyl-tRNA synthetase
MKDLYSFHKSEKTLLEYYENVKKSYKNIFDKLGI